MGLDMYAWTIPQGTGEDFSIPEEVERSELAYWRKFNALHGWMEDLARSKGFDGTFNCVPVLLTPADLNQLEESIKGNKLTPRSGFFFGGDTIYPEDLEDATKFIANARSAQADGFDVYYDSWW